MPLSRFLLLLHSMLSVAPLWAEDSSPQISIDRFYGVPKSGQFRAVYRANYRGSWNTQDPEKPRISWRGTFAQPISGYFFPTPNDRCASFLNDSQAPAVSMLGRRGAISPEQQQKLLEQERKSDPRALTYIRINPLEDISHEEGRPLPSHLGFLRLAAGQFPKTEIDNTLEVIPLPLETPVLGGSPIEINRTLFPHVYELGRLTLVPTHSLHFSDGRPLNERIDEKNPGWLYEGFKTAIFLAAWETRALGREFRDVTFFAHVVTRAHRKLYEQASKSLDGSPGFILHQDLGNNEAILRVSLETLLKNFPLTDFSEKIAQLKLVSKNRLSDEQILDLLILHQELFVHELQFESSDQPLFIRDYERVREIILKAKLRSFKLTEEETRTLIALISETAFPFGDEMGWRNPKYKDLAHEGETLRLLKKVSNRSQENERNLVMSNLEMGESEDAHQKVLRAVLGSYLYYVDLLKSMHDPDPEATLESEKVTFLLYNPYWYVSPQVFTGIEKPALVFPMEMGGTGIHLIRNSDGRESEIFPVGYAFRWNSAQLRALAHSNPVLAQQARASVQPSRSSLHRRLKTPPVF